MAKGPPKGTRPSGRQAGTKDTKYVERENRLQACIDNAVELLGEEIMLLTPKEVMLMAMRVALKAGFIFKAAEIADDVAPYIHAKLQSSTITAGNPDEAASDADLEEELEELRRREHVSRLDKGAPQIEQERQEEQASTEESVVEPAREKTDLVLA